MSSPPVHATARAKLVGLIVRRIGLLVAALIVLFVLVLSVLAYNRADRAYTARDTANNQKHAAQATATANGQAAQAVATDVVTLCDELKRLHHPCPVQSPDKVIKSITGQSGAPGAPGSQGPSGVPGRGIVHTTIDSTGHLLVSYSDGSVVDAGIARGAVGGTGKTGPSGRPGSNGRGISSTTISGGSLLVSYTDGSTRNLGSIIGPKGADGRGVAGSIIDSDGNLVIAYTDGTSQNLGNVIGPKGDKGDTGNSGPAGRGITSTSYDSDSGVLTITYTDNTTDQFHIKGDPGPQGVKGDKGDPGDPGSPGPSCPDGYHQTGEPNPTNPNEIWAVCASPSPVPTP